MINKLKIGLSAVAMLAMFGIASSASAAALTWTADQTVDLSSPDVNLTILSGSEATSLVVGAGSITVVVASGDTFTVTSADAELDVTGNSTSGVSNTCTSGLATVVINGDAETIVITASGSACDGGGGGGSSGSGGGGGSHRATPAVPANEVTPEGCEPGDQFSRTTGRNCNAAAPAVPAGCTTTTAFSPVNGQKCPTTNTNVNVTVVTGPGAMGAGYAFGVGLVKQGTKGPACRAWQNFLNDLFKAGLVVDGICGPKSMAAARAWQASAGLVADGLLGPMSRAKAVAQASFSAN